MECAISTCDRRLFGARPQVQGKVGRAREVKKHNKSTRTLARFLQFQDMKFRLLLFTLLVFLSCNPEARLKEAVNSIAESNSYMSSSVGIAGTTLDAYKCYEIIVDLATPEQLDSLIDHSSSAVRIYAFKGMVENNHPKSFEAFKRLANDQTGVSTMNGCFISSPPH